MFDTPDDAVQRLDNSLVLLDKRPVYLMHDTRYNYVAEDIISQETKIVHVNDEIGNGTLDIRAYDLGYVNVRDHTSLIEGKRNQVMFMARRPVRKYKAGVTYENTNQVAYSDREKRHVYSNLPQGFLRKKYVGECIIGEYPDFWKTYEELKESKESTSFAINRRIAFKKDEMGIIKIHYFLQPVAYLDANSKSVLYPRNFRYHNKQLVHELDKYKLNFRET